MLSCFQSTAWHDTICILHPVHCKACYHIFQFSVYCMTGCHIYLVSSLLCGMIPHYLVSSLLHGMIPHISFPQSSAWYDTILYLVSSLLGGMLQTLSFLQSTACHDTTLMLSSVYCMSWYHISVVFSLLHGLIPCPFILSQVCCMELYHLTLKKKLVLICMLITDPPLTHDMWHMTHDKWGEVNLLSKFWLPSSKGLGVKILGIFSQRITDSVNHVITKVFLELPPHNLVSWKQTCCAGCRRAQTQTLPDATPPIGNPPIQ